MMIEMPENFSGQHNGARRLFARELKCMEKLDGGEVVKRPPTTKVWCSMVLPHEGH